MGAKKTKNTKRKIAKNNLNKKIPGGWQPLRDLALKTPYTMGYLSLVARRKELKVKKIGRIWYSTMGNVRAFEEKMQQRKEERNKNLRNSYLEKAQKAWPRESSRVNISVMDDKRAEEILESVKDDAEKVSKIEAINNDTIFDEVQNDLEEILEEIRLKEKKIRHNYMIYRAGSMAQPIQRKKEKTEELSDRLIADMGKLLKTANEIHNDVEENNKYVSGAMRGDVLDKSVNDSDFLLGNHQKDNFLSVPYSYFPFEDKERNIMKTGLKPVSAQNKVLLFFSGVMIFIAAVLLGLVIFG